MRQAAYAEIWRAEDDIRNLNAEVAQRATKVGADEGVIENEGE